MVRAAEAVASKTQATGDELTGVNIMLEAVQAPIKVIAYNAGLSGEVVLENVRNGKGDYGFDAEAEQYGSMIEMGIVDPAKVARSAIENAASVAAMVLTTESLITELNPPKLPAPYDD